MNRKMLFFVNPNAGHAEIRSSLMEVLQVFTIGGYDVTVHPTRAPKDLTQTIAAHGAEYDMIVCTGGDGTLNEAVSGLMQLEKRPPLGYIPGGTVNDVASTLGLSHDPVTAAQDIVHGKPFAMDIGAFGKDRWFAYVAAFGLFTGVAYETPQEDKRVLGRLAYFLNGVRALDDVRPVHVRCTVNGETVETDAIDGLVCSTMSVGGFKVRSDMGISLNDGQAELLLVRDIKSLIDFHNVAMHLMRCEFQSEKEFVFRKAANIHFSFDEPVAWTVDGEYGGTYREVDVRIHQQAIRIIVPQALPGGAA